MNEYKLARRASACMECERPYADEEWIVSAIYPEGESFARRDLCERCFRDAGAAHSHWRARQPVAPDERKRLDFDLAMSFFHRLVREADPARDAITYLLALLLSRKRRVKIRQSRRLPEGELLTVLVPGDEEEQTLLLRAPRLSANDVEPLQAELELLLGLADTPPAPPEHPHEGGGNPAPQDHPPESSARARPTQP